MPGIIDTHSHFAISGVNEATLPWFRVRPRRDRLRGRTDLSRARRRRHDGSPFTRQRERHRRSGRGCEDEVRPPGGRDARPERTTRREVRPRENVKRTDGGSQQPPRGRSGPHPRVHRGPDYRKKWTTTRKAGQQRTASGAAATRLEALADVLAGDLRVTRTATGRTKSCCSASRRFGVKVKSLQHVLEGTRSPRIAA